MTRHRGILAQDFKQQGRLKRPLAGSAHDGEADRVKGTAFIRDRDTRRSNAPKFESSGVPLAILRITRRRNGTSRRDEMTKCKCQS